MKRGGCSFFFMIELEQHEVSQIPAGAVNNTDASGNSSDQPTPLKRKKLKVLLVEDSPVNKH